MFHYSMTSTSNDIFEDINTQDFSLDEKKWLKNLIEKDFPLEIKENLSFKEKLRKRLKKVIQEKKSEEKSLYIQNLPSFAKWRLRFSGFVGAFVVFIFIIMTSFFSDFFSGKLTILQKFSENDGQTFTNFSILTPYQANDEWTKSMKTMKVMNVMENEEDTDHSEIRSKWVIYQNVTDFETTNTLSDEQILSDIPSTPLLWTLEQRFLSAVSGMNSLVSYRFFYHGKYPKIDPMLSVYKIDGTLMDPNFEEQSINTLKIENFSLPLFTGKQIKTLTLTSASGNTLIDLDFVRGTASIQTFSRSDSTELNSQNNDLGDYQLSEGTLKKHIIKKVKSLWISLKNYDDIEIHVWNSAVHFEFPLLIDGFEVYFPSLYEKKYTLYGTYLPATDEISLFNIDIAKYLSEKHSSLSQDQVLERLATGWDFFDEGVDSEYAVWIEVEDPKLVYLFNENGYFVPALQFHTDTEETPFDHKPQVLYIQLTK